MNLEQLKYPIGKFQAPATIDFESLKGWISDIVAFPSQVQEETQGLSDAELGWRYRPEGWNIRQVVHHCADSHMNAFIRIKLGLSEDRPKIKPYLEAEWAKQADYAIPIAYSIELLKGLHFRWAGLLKHLREEQLRRTFLHPEHDREWSIYETAALYAWHGKHHLGHIRQAKQRKREE